MQIEDEEYGWLWELLKKLLGGNQITGKQRKKG